MFKNALDLISALAALREPGSAGRVEAEGEAQRPNSIIRACRRVKRDSRSLEAGFVRNVVIYRPASSYMEFGASSPASEVRSDISSTMGLEPSPGVARFFLLHFFEVVVRVVESACLSGVGVATGEG